MFRGLGLSTSVSISMQICFFPSEWDPSVSILREHDTFSGVQLPFGFLHGPDNNWSISERRHIRRGSLVSDGGDVISSRYCVGGPDASDNEMGPLCRVDTDSVLDIVIHNGVIARKWLFNSSPKIRMLSYLIILNYHTVNFPKLCTTRALSR